MMTVIVQMANRSKTAYTQQGAIMVEVLVALFFVVVVFMGHIGSQTFMQKSSIEASRRAHAQILLNDMVERMQANRAVAQCYAFTNGGAPFVGIGGGPPTCTGFGTPDTQARATQDLLEWHQALLNGGVTDQNNSPIGGLKNGRGCISIDETTTPATYNIAVAWEGSSPQTIPGNALPENDCARGLYGSEDPTLRRIISRQVQFGNLSS